MDYIIADRIIIPETEQHLFREKAVYLPDTFMGTDAERTVAADTPTRAHEGLPESGFVFCSFSNPYKISPQIFDVWMEVLRTTDDSLLWLSNTNDVAKDNLRREAKQRGVNPERIVFARRVALNQDHFARHRLADLLLDTMPLGARSTVCMHCGRALRFSPAQVPPSVVALGRVYSQHLGLPSSSRAMFQATKTERFNLLATGIHC